MVLFKLPQNDIFICYEDDNNKRLLNQFINNERIVDETLLLSIVQSSPSVTISSSSLFTTHIKDLSFFKSTLKHAVTQTTYYCGYRSKLHVIIQYRTCANHENREVYRFCFYMIQRDLRMLCTITKHTCPHVPHEFGGKRSCTHVFI